MDGKNGAKTDSAFEGYCAGMKSEIREGVQWQGWGNTWSGLRDDLKATVAYLFFQPGTRYSV